MYNNDTSAIFAGTMVTILWLFSLALYIVQGLAFYKLAKKAGIGNAWFAWVPILQYILFLHLINKNGWNILLLIIPIANVVLMIIWYVKFFNAFGMSGAWVLLVIFVPVGLLILLLVMAFSENIHYTLTDNRYVES